MTPRKYPTIICIDGTDGSGKHTISKRVEANLLERGFKVAIISPPFYETHTGMAVKDYLMNGYGDIRDRRLVSDLYSADRNYFYRSHFNEIFTSGNYDYIIYDRSWISNLIYQTTLCLQTPEDEKNFLHEPVHIRYGTPDFAKYHYADAVLKNQFMTLEQMRVILDGQTGEPLPTDVKEFKKLLGIEALFDHQRRQLVRDHMIHVYGAEIQPWGVVEDDNDMPVPFIKRCKIINFMLVPEVGTGTQFARTNMMDRNSGDASKMDRNEVSSRYLDSVVENAHWIDINFDDICADPIRPSDLNGDSEGRNVLQRACDDIGIIQKYTLATTRRVMPSVRMAFKYRIIHTTKFDKTGKIIQVDLNTIEATVMKRINRLTDAWANHE